MSCGFYYKKQWVLSKSPCFLMCKWFTNMDIIDKTVLVKGYKNCNDMTGYKNFV